MVRDEMFPGIITKIYILVSYFGYDFEVRFLNNIHNSSSSSFDPFDYLRTHTTTTNDFSYFPLLIPFIIFLVIFIIAWMISNRRKKED